MGICTQTPKAHHNQAIPAQPSIRYTLAYVATLNVIRFLGNVIILPFKSAHLVGGGETLVFCWVYSAAIKRDISCHHGFK